jgi:hypothetical protein
MSGLDLAAVITALGVFVTTVVGAIVTLRHEFKKAAAKTEEIHELVNSQHTEVQGQLETANREIQTLKDERNGTK